jgi:hypothetical protein
MSPRYERKVLGGQLYEVILQRLISLFPGCRLRSLSSPNPAPGTIPLPNEAQFYDYVVVNQHRYVASSRSPNRTNSLVDCVVYANDGTSQLWTGELTDIIRINQEPAGVFTLAQICWFRPLHLDITETIWHA